MKVFHQAAEMAAFVAEKREKRRKIGFVPTMGALHDGHISLLQQAGQQADCVLCSIYVNPTQFNDPADYQAYPQTLEADLAKLQAARCDAVFAPTHAAIYPEGMEKAVAGHTPGAAATLYEGAHRPGHFQGVVMVVERLLRICQPDVAFFGQKDLQQVAVIREMTRKLFPELSLVTCATVRELDGLAMSSRNARLNVEERLQATLLYKALSVARQQIRMGESLENACLQARLTFESNALFELAYFEAVDGETIQPAHANTDPDCLALIVAAFLGNTRLIDNCWVYRDS